MSFNFSPALEPFPTQPDVYCCSMTRNPCSAVDQTAPARLWTRPRSCRSSRVTARLVNPVEPHRTPQKIKMGPKMVNLLSNMYRACTHLHAMRVATSLTESTVAIPRPHDAGDATNVGDATKAK
eukprot:3086601-Amphidinium_carterae.2